MKMRNLLSIERIIPSLHAADKSDALRKLAVVGAINTASPADIVVGAVLDGAEMPAFGPSTGISLPHAFIPGLGDPFVIFAKLNPPVDFGATDGSKTDLVALLLSPLDNAGGHLQALACVARTLRDAHVRKLLRGAESRDSIYAILCGYEETQDLAASSRGELRQSAD
jgi:PTS system nitrogen regulatory IIA component